MCCYLSCSGRFRELSVLLVFKSEAELGCGHPWHNDGKNTIRSSPQVPSFGHLWHSEELPLCNEINILKKPSGFLVFFLFGSDKQIVLGSAPLSFWPSDQVCLLIYNLLLYTLFILGSYGPQNTSFILTLFMCLCKHLFYNVSLLGLLSWFSHLILSSSSLLKSAPSFPSHFFHPYIMCLFTHMSEWCDTILLVVLLWIFLII